ncbi:hypothetical protein Mesil_1891 [Allomeiothermus silvanus DSM 9946]|uniref:Uncharacterized protein n=1 Tax=Allomeiothermus silvanus (strain ATCC 700542 / DSM 9946 / NBRC 106475 / NCIMB 13440 / VI-R2) TaxID=526227 RepID=D7BGF1_ALLS1|nr:hypothetical protein Mesil_1891 [Allomeiothermus silvanus DSM 9946]
MPLQAARRLGPLAGGHQPPGQRPPLGVFGLRSLDPPSPPVAASWPHPPQRVIAGRRKAPSPRGLGRFGPAGPPGKPGPAQRLGVSWNRAATARGAGPRRPGQSVRVADAFFRSAKVAGAGTLSPWSLSQCSMAWVWRQPHRRGLTARASFTAATIWLREGPVSMCLSLLHASPPVKSLLIRLMPHLRRSVSTICRSFLKVDRLAAR